ncbi:hypothetical protein DL93DRAFT_2083574 [Clavulina sp. PMI_390]|nr:hypothetical protein DL93DRAFT_2083574 [Clavulina sp. PMI_390]
MNYIQGIWNDQNYLPLDDFICLKHLNATLPPWTMAHFLPFFGKATALAEVSLGLQLSTEHEPLVAVFEAISMTLRTAHIRSMAHASGDLLEMMEREYSVAPAARRITFPLLETFISDVYVGGVVIAATRQAPQLQFLALSSPNDRNEFDVSEALIPPFVEAPRLHTLIINGFSPVCHSIDAPNLNRLNVLALKYPLSQWNTLWAYTGINIVRLIKRFATSLQHLEIHEAIQGKAQTKPHPHLYDSSIYTEEPLSLPKLHTLYINPYDAFLECISAPNVRVLHLAQTSHASPLWSSLKGVSSANTLILGSVYSDTDNMSSIPWRSLREVSVLRIVINVDVRNRSGAIPLLEKHTRRIRLLSEPVAKTVISKLPLAMFENEEIDPDEWLLPKLAHIEIHLASGKEAFVHAFDGVANGDPGYETDSSVGAEQEESASEEGDGGSTCSAWPEDSEDAADFYSNSSAWGTESEDMDRKRDERDTSVPRGSAMEGITDHATSITLGAGPPLFKEGFSAASQQYKPDIDSDAIKPSHVSSKSTRPPEEPPDHLLNVAYYVADPHDLNGAEEDLIRILGTPWPRDLLPIFDSGSFKVVNNRKAFRRLLHVSVDVARARRRHEPVANLTLITVSSSTQNGSG